MFPENVLWFWFLLCFLDDDQSQVISTKSRTLTEISGGCNSDWRYWIDECRLRRPTASAISVPYETASPFDAFFLKTSLTLSSFLLLQKTLGTIPPSSKLPPPKPTILIKPTPQPRTPPPPLHLTLTQNEPSLLIRLRSHRPRSIRSVRNLAEQRLRAPKSTKPSTPPGLHSIEQDPQPSTRSMSCTPFRPRSWRRRRVPRLSGD